MNEQENLNAESNLSRIGQIPSRQLSAPNICHNPMCSFQTHESFVKCPKCGRPMLTASTFQALSFALMFCGFLLLIIGFGLGYIAYRNYVSPDNQPRRADLALYLLTPISVFISALGSTIITNGAWQAIFGRANQRLIFVMLAFVTIFFILIGTGRLVIPLFLD